MTRNLQFAAAAALALGLTACNEPSPAQTTEGKRDRSPQAQLDADMALSSKVKAAVAERSRGRIEVAANDGVVTIYGTVDAPSDKQSFALAAMGVEGVRSVVNNLVVLRGS